MLLLPLAAELPAKSPTTPGSLSDPNIFRTVVQAAVSVDKLKAFACSLVTRTLTRLERRRFKTVASTETTKHENSNTRKYEKHAGHGRREVQQRQRCPEPSSHLSRWEWRRRRRRFRGWDSGGGGGAQREGFRGAHLVGGRLLGVPSQGARGGAGAVAPHRKVHGQRGGEAQRAGQPRGAAARDRDSPRTRGQELVRRFTFEGEQVGTAPICT